MNWQEITGLLSRILFFLFFGILGITLIHFYPLIGLAGVCTYALLFSLSWAAAYLGVGMLKWITRIDSKLLISFMALFLLLHLLLDEMTLLSQVLLTPAIGLLGFGFTWLWLQELRYWNILTMRRDGFVQFAVLAGIISLSMLIYAFSAKENPERATVEANSAAIKYFYYGSQPDKQLPMYADSIRLLTKPVDASHLITNWSGFHGYIRTKFWGFEPDRLPLNGHVWYPAGEGKKPLVLMVHGNHLDRDLSDGGFAYLGKYLAEHGFIAVSVDENFLNSSWAEIADGIQGDIPTRAWLLLKHLEVWQTWNNSPGNIFYNKIDTSRIGLIGHSRGGEAVAWAHYLNGLPYNYNKPEEAKKEKFAINALISLTPTDGYQAQENGLLQLTNVNYLQIQGGRDMDLLYHSGQYDRVNFTHPHSYVKAKLFVPNANHNHFNEDWGSYDVLFPNSLFVSAKGLLPPVKQQNLTKAAVLAFLQSSFYQDHTFHTWVKAQSFPAQIGHANAISIADFEEDQNLQSATWRNARLCVMNATTWQEKQISATASIFNGRALHLAWDKVSLDTPLGFVIDSLNIFTTNGLLTMDVLPEQEQWPTEMEVEITDVAGNKSLHKPGPLRKGQTSTGSVATLFSLFPENVASDKVFQTIQVPVGTQNIASIKLIIKGPAQGGIWLDNFQLQPF